MDVAQPFSQSTEIADAARSCISSFESCLSTKVLMKEGWAESRLADINLWASGVGALATPEASLDRRLQFQPNVRLVLTSLLFVLQELVQYCRICASENKQKEIHEDEDGSKSTISINEGSVQSDSDDGSDTGPSSMSWFKSLDPGPPSDLDSSTDLGEEAFPEETKSESTLSKAMKDTEDILDQLLMLGYAIRKSGTVARLQRADSSFKLDSNKGFRMQLESIFLNATKKKQWSQGGSEEVTSADRMKKAGDFKDVNEVTAQQHHLITANMRRRHRFQYARRHQQKLDTSTFPSLLLKSQLKADTSKDKVSDSTKSSDQVDKQQSSLDSQDKKLSDGTGDIAKVKGTSGTAPSAVEGDILKASIPLQAAASRVSVSIAKMNYPSPPPVSNDMRGFKCPCCYQTLPEMLQERSRWMKHLVEDLCPYTCPFPECPSPEVLYISRSAWRTHIVEAHSAGQYWECLVCAGTPTPNTFTSSEEFGDHNRTKHKDIISEEHLADLQESCRKMAPPNISQCPLCPWPQEEEIEPDAMANLEHVGNCIHEFSLNALPWVQSQHEMTVDQVSVIVSRVEEWLSQAEDPIERTKLEKIEIGDFPPRPDPLPSTNQDEDVVEYGFVESSGGASRAGTRSDIRSVDFESSKSDPSEVPEHKHDVLGAGSSPNKYTIGWICAFSSDFIAAQSFLDEPHEDPEFLSPNDDNIYALGRAGKHNVVIAVLPDGEIGTSVARDMLHSFPNVRVGLMVSIGGGAPSREHDIRLGDVVVSISSNGNSGVLQYDFGKTVQDQTFQMTGTLDRLPSSLRNAVGRLQANYEMNRSPLNSMVNDVIKKHPRLRKRFSRPPPSSDMLYMSNIVHPTNTPGQCAEVCPTDTKFMILRAKRDGYEDDPVIHYGRIASANHVMKDALLRDNLAAERDILCFEAEAAGLMNHFPCLVIRGVCDYSDSHKNDMWQGYAAMVAAAYARDLLNEISPTIVETEKSINEGLKSISSPRIENFAVGDQFQNFGTGSQNNNTGSGTQVNYNNWSQ